MNPQEPMNPNFDGPASSRSAGFCQNCGTPLTEQSRRTVGSAVFCEPCLEARLNGAPGTTQTGYTQTGATQTQVPYAATYAGWPVQPAPVTPAPPNPVLAGLLGFIPGVGAMYNEQYAKGIAHVAIFALLVALTNEFDLFGLFIAGWVFYMAFEAYHTALARRNGTPLPNGFGLNDLGERLGFARGWHSPTAAQPVPPPNGTYPPPYASQPYASQPYASQQPDPPVSAEAPPFPAASAPWGAPAEASLNQVVAFPQYTPLPPAPEPLAEAPAPVPAVMRFPAGAVWLILLGVVFLLSTTGIFRVFSAEALIGWSLIFLSGWLFFRNFHAQSGLQTSLAAAPYTRLYRGLQASVWVLTSGVLALLDSFHLLRWNRSWPIFLIVAGVLALLGRVAAQHDDAAPQPTSQSRTTPSSL